MKSTIRPYHATDLVSLYRICLLTGDNGADASHLLKDPDIMGHYYAAPYAVFEPDLCFVLLHDGQPCGYILGTRDSMAFRLKCEQEWYPPLRQRYPLSSAGDYGRFGYIVQAIHEGHGLDEALVVHYPAHLHIDILPIGQGQGWGRKLMETFLDRLRELDVPGVYLGVGLQNHSAIKFYGRMGLHEIKRTEHSLILGMRL